MVKLSDEQEKEGFWVEQREGNYLVWHHDNQIAFFLFSPDIERRVEKLIERHRKDFREIEKKTGWRPSQ